jgi:predicted KAP-like P-loop ATPase
MFNADSPITTEKDDLLNRDTFAKQLAKAIMSYNQLSSFNIGLYGEWGSGKTSVINMVEENIISLTSELTKKPVIIRFNPWLFSDQTQLTIQFFKQLSSAYKRTNAVKAIGNAMDALGSAFEFISVPMAGSSGGAIAKLVKGIGKGLADKNPSPDIQKLKDEIAAKLQKEKVKTIIIIDDVDRLSNQEICCVFQLIKSIADFPNTIYLLAFDFEVVSRALGKVQNTDGKKYLEKIIQVPFHLPKINEQQLTNLFFKGLNNIIREVPEEKFDKERWGLLFYYGIKEHLKTIRDVVRLNNTISLKYSFLKDEVNIIDLIGITTIQVFAPNIYNQLQFYKDNFCGIFSSYKTDDNEKKDFANLYESIIRGLDENRYNNISEILSVLFPKVSEVKKNIFSGRYYQYNAYDSIRLGSICNKDYFERYFSLSLIDSLSLQEAEYIIFNAAEEEISSLLLNIDKRNKTNLFLDYFDSSMKRLKETDSHGGRINMLLNSILENWDSFHDADANQFLSYPWTWRLLNVVDSCLRAFSEEADRFSSILNIFKNKKVSLSVKINILLRFEREHNRYLGENEKERTPEEYILYLEHVLILEEICLSYVEKLMDDGDLTDINKLLDNKWFIENSKNDNLIHKFNDYIRNIKQTDEGLGVLISSLVGRGKGSGTFVYDLWNIDLKYMSNYLDIEDTVIRMSNFIHMDRFNALGLELKEDIIAFLSFYEVKDEAFRESATRQLIEKFCKRNNIILEAFPKSY